MIPAKISFWLQSSRIKPFQFQLDSWEAISKGESGLVNAPTGYGKTLATFLPVTFPFVDGEVIPNGIQLIWITPLRALASDLAKRMQTTLNELGMNWKVGERHGDISEREKKAQKERLPEVLIITPESLHLLFTNLDQINQLNTLQYVVVDEWHELLGNKRGVLVELSLAYLRNLIPEIPIWGISATIENLDEAASRLVGPSPLKTPKIIRSREKKIITIDTLIPDSLRNLPWAGHHGLKLAEDLIPALKRNNSTLIFTNTRAQSELWYQKILELEPEFAGLIAIHHGSLSKEIRSWVEKAIDSSNLKAVVCTSSLDLGVDFKPVSHTVQIGSPKGIARFIQRAGRSGHRPGMTSSITFVPTHAMELLEGSALHTALSLELLEPREMLNSPLDVVIQFALTMAIADGIELELLKNILRQTITYKDLRDEDFEWCIHFIVNGGNTLGAYDDYKKASVINGRLRINTKKFALLHKMNIGTIVGQGLVDIVYANGQLIGKVEEWFINQLKPGESFWFAGRSLKYDKVVVNKVFVKKGDDKTGKVPSYMGGRMPLSSKMSTMLRQQIEKAANGIFDTKELKALIPLMKRQKEESYLPSSNELLIERYESKEGFHLFIYPFEGRLVHEGLAALIAFRIARELPITFSIAMNDYGFELLSSKEIPIERINQKLFSSESLSSDILQAVNSTEMARKQFYEIARISGLMPQSFTKGVEKQLRINSQTLFDIFLEHEPENKLVQQAYDEVLQNQLEEIRMRRSLMRIKNSEIKVMKLSRPSPFSFPILADRLRDKLSSEQYESSLLQLIQAYNNEESKI